MNNRLSGINLLIILALLGLSSAFVPMRVRADAISRALVATNCAPSYVVRSGDTLSAIARRCGVSTSSLAQANGLSLNSVIYPGQQLTMPGTAASASNTGTRGTTIVTSGSAQASTGCPGTYTVRAGDTLSSIARRCGVSVTSLKQWNGLSSDTIRVGQTLITSGVRSSAAPAIRAAPTVVTSSGVSRHTYTVATPTPYWAPASLPAAVSTPTPSIESTVSPW